MNIMYEEIVSKAHLIIVKDVWEYNNGCFWK